MAGPLCLPIGGISQHTYLILNYLSTYPQPAVEIIMLQYLVVLKRFARRYLREQTLQYRVAASYKGGKSMQS